MSVTRMMGTAAALVLGLLSSAALAQNGYGGLSYFDWSIESDAPDIESAGVRASGGYMFNDFLGVEAHVASGGSDEVEYPTGPSTTEEVEVELNKLVAAFAKANLPLPLPRVESNVYALAGYAYGRADILAQDTATRITENGFAWGAGADIALIADRLYLTADYIEYVSGDDADASAASLGLRLSFGGGR